MNNEFFPLEVFQSKKPLGLPLCGSCKLYKSCKSPKMRVDGDGKKEILIIGEAPGKYEDASNQPFVGKSGKYLEGVLRNLDVDLRYDCWLTNAIICHIEGNKKPTSQQIGYCRPNVIGLIETLKPKVIILIGGYAVKSLIGHLWREDAGGITRWAGFNIPCQRYNAWICPVFHPSYCFREEEKNNPMPGMFFRKHLEKAMEYTSRPWKEIPNYQKEVEIEVEGDQVVKSVQEIIQAGYPVAVDYETNMLKPDSNEAEIVSCAVSNGVRTISYPWIGKTREVTKELLLSPLKKVFSNQKFELRWTIKEFGHGIKECYFDTMLASHVIDSRRGITSIKFQAFVLLGQEPWDEHIKPYLKSPGGNTKNRIRELDLNQLLVYGGIDALLEWKVANIQRKLL